MLVLQDLRIYKSALSLLIWTVSTHKAPSSWARSSHFHRAPFLTGATHPASTRTTNPIHRNLECLSMAGLAHLLDLKERLYHSSSEKPVLLSVDTYQVWCAIFQIWKAFTMLSSMEPECCWTDEKQFTLSYPDSQISIKSASAP